MFVVLVKVVKGMLHNPHFLLHLNKSITEPIAIVIGNVLLLNSIKTKKLF